MRDVAAAMKAALLGSAVDVQSAMTGEQLIVRLMAASTRRRPGGAPGAFFLQDRGIDPSRARVRLALMRIDAKNGTAPVFSGIVTTTPSGHCRLTGVIRFATTTRLVMLAMFVLPAVALAVAVVNPAGAPRGGIGFPIFLLAVLVMIVAMFADGAVEPTGDLHERLRRIAHTNAAGPPAT